MLYFPIFIFMLVLEDYFPFKSNSLLSYQRFRYFLSPLMALTLFYDLKLKKHVLTCFLLTVDLVNCFFNYLVLSTSDDKKQYQAVRVTGFQICI